MQLASLAVLSTAALGLFAARPLWSQAETSQKLEKVALPSDERAEAWKHELTERDLDLRESNFRSLAAQARHDRELVRALEEWARDEANLELAWTARLALRAARDPFQSMFGHDAFGAWGFDPQAFGGFDAFDGPFGRFHLGQPLLPAPGADSSSRSQTLQLQSGPDGVTVKIERDEEGQKKTEEYKAGSIEELLQAHPQLRDQLGGAGGSGLWLRSGAAAPWPWLRGETQGLTPFGAPGAGVESKSVRRTDVLGVLVRELASGESALAKQGLMVERVEPGTIAQALGLRRGHLLQKINGREIASAGDITEALASREEDAPVTVEFLDGFGQVRTRTWKPHSPQAEGNEAPATPQQELRKI
jgi:hypothetical protein